MGRQSGKTIIFNRSGSGLDCWFDLSLGSWYTCSGCSSMIIFSAESYPILYTKVNDMTDTCVERDTKVNSNMCSKTLFRIFIVALLAIPYMRSYR